MNNLFLALNGEKLDATLYKNFEGIGLIRPEYICRKMNMFVTQSKLLTELYNYVDNLCSLDSSKAVWYRFTDLTVKEVNVLYGCDYTLYDNKHFMGLKGVRRHLKYTDAFKKEVEVLSEISKKHKNIGVVIPFISNVQELIAVKQILKDCNYCGKIGIMLEIPSVYLNLQAFIDCGIDKIIIGLNDLSTFTTAKYREYEDFNRKDQAIVNLIKNTKKTCEINGISLSIAGYFNKEDFEFYSNLNINLVINYANLNVLNLNLKNIGETSYLQEVKNLSKNKIIEMEKRKMKYGMPTLFEFNSIEENLDWCKKLGLDFLELNLDLPYCLPENINIEAVKKYDLEITVHLSEKLEIGEINEESRKSGLKLALKQMDFFVKNLNVKKFNIHIDRGVYFNIDGKKNFIFEKYADLYNKSIDCSMKELSEFAVANNVEILFENVSVSNPTQKSFENVKNYAGLYYTLDIGHDERNKNIMSNYFAQDEQMIHHIHLHDTDGNKDHFELGSGIIDKKKFLDMAKRLGVGVVIEVKSLTALKNSIDYIKKIGY